MYLSNLIMKWMVLLFVCFPVTLAAKDKKDIEEMDGVESIPVTVIININKIYNVNAPNETYSIDGYMVMRWNDKRAYELFSKNNGHKKVIGITGAQIESYVEEGFWFPDIEFINVIGMRTIPKSRVTIKSNGDVMYNERFDATFTSNMNFRRFPFDNQKFLIEIESFSMDTELMVFVERAKDELDKENENISYFNSEWNPKVKEERVSTITYPHLGGSKFSRYTIEIVTHRVPNYYIWQFILPLFLIILSSWSVFWIEDFSSQLGTSFTLMLTVVAFNFYTSNILPRLPYTSFLDALVILGYLSIFVGVLFVVGKHLWVDNSTEPGWVKKACYRFSIPLLVTLFCAALIAKYFYLDKGI